MSLNTMQQNTITKAVNVSKYLVEQIKPLLDELDNTYNSAGGLASTIQQADLDAISTLSGLTTTQLSDGMFALTSTLKSNLATAYTALLVLATRG